MQACTHMHIPVCGWWERERERGGGGREGRREGERGGGRECDTGSGVEGGEERRNNMTSA